jgi:hypothetical protein
MKANLLVATSFAALFNSAVANAEPPAAAIPLDQQNTITVSAADGESQLFNANYIMQTGQAGDDYHFDFSRHDSFMTALHTIASRSYQDILDLEQNDPDGFGALMALPRWTHDQRAEYEAALATIVADESVRIPGFEQYRTIPQDGVSGFVVTDQGHVSADIENISLLNTLSADIDRDSENLRYDCGVQSAIKIIILQTLENRLLPQQGQDGADYKKSLSYFYTTGTVSGESFDLKNQIGYHAFIFTPAGNIVEATDDPDPSQIQSDTNLQAILDDDSAVYVENDNSLEQFVRGRAVVQSDGSIYDPLRRPIADHDTLRQNPTVLGDEPSDIDADEFVSHYGSIGYAVMDDRAQGFMAAYQRQNDGSYNVYFAQKENIGMPDEGFAFTDSGNYHPDERAPTFSLQYNDALTGQGYNITFNTLGGQGDQAAIQPRAATADATAIPPPPTLSDLAASFLKAADQFAGTVETYMESAAASLYKSAVSFVFG